MENAEAPGTAKTPVQTTKSLGSKFKVVNITQEHEDAYDVVGQRNLPKASGAIASVAHLVKGALGSGILTGHVAYMKAGYLVALVLNGLLGVYMTYCLYILVISAQKLYRRTGIPSMSYPDVGEAAVACFPNPKIARLSKCFRHWIDVTICLDLFGSCTTYMIIMAKTIKQLVENVQISTLHGAHGYPHLRIYLVAVMVPFMLICMVRHLQWLAPFSIFGNLLLLLCIGVTIYYATVENPTFSDLKPATTPGMAFEFIGMIVFSMSCSGVVVAIENNMREPHKYGPVLIIGMSIITCAIIVCSFFGYVAYRENSDSPITVNFPMTIFPKILKGLIAVMIYITFALNFWVPFNICFHYIRKCHKEEHIVRWELLYRVLFVGVITIVGVTFPSISALMGFLGCFCLSNMAFIWPNVIQLLVIWHRPGLGAFKWRLWRSTVLIAIGLVLFCAGTVVSLHDLIKSVSSDKSS